MWTGAVCRSSRRLLWKQRRASVAHAWTEGSERWGQTGQRCVSMLSSSSLNVTTSERLEERARKLAQRHAELSEQLRDGGISADHQRALQLYKETGQLASLAEMVKIVDSARARELEAEELARSAEEAEWRELCEDEVSTCREQRREAEASLLNDMIARMLPDDGTSETTSAILEVRAGTGGEEAALFAEELVEMYQAWCDRNEVRFEVLSIVPGPDGHGARELVASVKGEKAWSVLRYEAGVHRVQRVPRTESAGRIHTSTVSIAVLPGEMKGFEDVPIRDEDLKIETMRASGAGGQHVNKTESAVRITHIPSGIVVQNQDERHQIRNRKSAMQELQSRLNASAAAQALEATSSARREQLGINLGERSDKIRTYNFAQSRVTDHRVPGLSLSNKLTMILEGGPFLDEMLVRVVNHFQSELISSVINQMDHCNEL